MAAEMQQAEMQQALMMQQIDRGCNMEKGVSYRTFGLSLQRCAGKGVNSC